MKAPLYRAKKIDSDRYVFGFYYYDKNLDTHHIKYILDPREGYNFGRTMHPRVDETTLSISFEDMKDSEGTRIFASLSENGKGGDILTSEGYPFKSEEEYNYQAIVIMIFNQPQFVYQKISDRVRGVGDGINESFDENYDSFTVTGIQE